MDNILSKPPSEEQPSTSPVPTFEPSKAMGHRRQSSLPLQFIPSNTRVSRISSVSLVDSDESALGEPAVDNATIEHRISALRQLNGLARSQHRYAKSTDTRSSTFSQPVIVRTYSGSTRSQPRQNIPPEVKTEKKPTPKKAHSMDAKLPPIEAFSFKGIMDEIKNDIAEDLDKIAEICARTKYSLSNQYEVHMPPHGGGDPVLEEVRARNLSELHINPGELIIQSPESDEELPRSVGRSLRGQRRTKPSAYGTLETIMSSSRSSDEDKVKKEPAAELAEVVRGRAVKKTVNASNAGASSISTRPRSATFASIVIDNTQTPKHDPSGHTVAITPLIIEPTCPKTSTATDKSVGMSGMISTEPVKIPSTYLSVASNPRVGHIASGVLTPSQEPENKSSFLESLTLWLPWIRSSRHSLHISHTRTKSQPNAIGSLRELLRSSDLDTKGKGLDRVA